MKLDNSSCKRNPLKVPFFAALWLSYFLGGVSPVHSDEDSASMPVAKRIRLSETNLFPEEIGKKGFCHFVINTICFSFNKSLAIYQ